MKLILIGEENTKRTSFLKEACAHYNVQLQLLEWKELLRGVYSLEALKGAAVKVDPPVFSIVRLVEMQKQLSAYQAALQRLEQAECSFLNTPGSIWRMLDKRGTKERLQSRGIAVTQLFSEEIRNAEQLLEAMRQRRCDSVFVKPRFFSGAAGVAACRIHPKTGQMLLYTSARLERGQLINSKKLFKLHDREEICQLLEKLLSLDCVVERWHSKSEFHGKSYDLRVAFQFGHIAHIVARQSSGPITNLHLNNQALEVDALGLGEKTMQAIEMLCSQAVSQFTGVQMAGIDILLEKETMRPLLIEMNGQGDLIYQDIYRKNKIYKEQVRKLCKK